MFIRPTDMPRKRTIVPPLERYSMNTEIITLDDLKDVFYSGYPAATAWDVIDELYIAIHEDVLTYKRYAVSSTDHYHHLIDSAIIAE